jgi:hypothetical protein
MQAHFLVGVLAPLVLAWGAEASAQEIPGSSEVWQEPVFPRSFGLALPRSSGDLAVSSHPPPVYLFRMPSAFDPLPADPDDADTPGDGRLQVMLAPDNPYFDFRRRGDPGGVGFYKLQSQVSLLDGPTSGFRMALRAVTPAGLQADGVAEGATVFSPSFSWFCGMPGDTALHAYLGKDVCANSRWTESLERDIRYGIAWTGPCPGFDGEACRNIRLFVEALGRYHLDNDPGRAGLAGCELLPGVQWRLCESCWVSGGILMPIAAPLADRQLWQVTCSWQF